MLMMLSCSARKFGPEGGETLTIHAGVPMQHEVLLSASGGARPGSLDASDGREHFMIGTYRQTRLGTDEGYMFVDCTRPHQTESYDRG